MSAIQNHGQVTPAARSAARHSPGMQRSDHAVALGDALLGAELTNALGAGTRSASPKSWCWTTQKADATRTEMPVCDRRVRAGAARPRAVEVHRAAPCRWLSTRAFGGCWLIPPCCRILGRFTSPNRLGLAVAAAIRPGEVTPEQERRALSPRARPAGRRRLARPVH
jgi:hypothetical protein